MTISRPRRCGIYRRIEKKISMSSVMKKGKERNKTPAFVIRKSVRTFKSA